MFWPLGESTRMKSAAIVVSVLLASLCSGACADDIRHLSLRAKEKLGRELFEQSRRGTAPLTEAQQRAKRAAMDALRQLDKSYRFFVLNDLERKGHLVYALATSSRPDDIVAGVHYRVTVSGDGNVERVDALARGPLVIRKNGPDMPAGYHHAGFMATNSVSSEPVETFVYLSLLHHEPAAVVTSDGALSFVEDGKIRKDTKKR